MQGPQEGEMLSGFIKNLRRVEYDSIHRNSGRVGSGQVWSGLGMVII